MRQFLATITLYAFLFSQIAWSGDFAPRTDKLKLGLPASGANKVIEFNAGLGSANPKIQYDLSTSSLEFANDGATFKSFGSGSGGNGEVVGGLITSNADLESGVTGLTASGGSLAPITSGSNLAYGKGSASWNPSAGSQTLATGAITIPAGLYGHACAVKLTYKTAEATNLYRLDVVDGSGTDLVKDSSDGLAGQKLYSNTNFQDGYAFFACPSSGTIAWKLIAASTVPTNPIYFDDLYLGANPLLTQVSQAQFYGSAKWPETASCNWSSTTNASFAPFSAVAACTFPSGSNLEGYASAPATKVPGITFANLPPGDYEVVATGDFVTVSTGNQCGWAISDGTTTKKAGVIGAASTATSTYSNNLVARFNYSTSQSNVTFQIEGTGDGGSEQCNVNDNTYVQDLTLWVYRYPTQTDQVFSAPAGQSISWAGYHTGSWTMTTSGTPSTFGDFTTGNSPVLTPSPNATSLISCVTDATAAIPGITCNLPRPGNYRVCANTQVSLTASNIAMIQLTDGSDHVLASSSGVTIAASGQFDSVQACGKLYASAGQITFKLKGGSNAASQSLTLGSSAFAHSIDWDLVDVDQSFPSPVLSGTGTVSISGSGNERVERASIANSGTCSITSQSGSWVSSVNATPANGGCTLNISPSEWSSAPTCVCSVTTSLSGSDSESCFVQSASTSSIVWRVGSGSSTYTNDPVNIICMGPK